MEQNNDLISVIVPVYNVEEYLQKCLDSIVASTYQNLEIICINDASPDGSWEILQQYAEKDQRIVLINCPENGGLPAARNKGLDIATGAYIAFVDSDDYVDPAFFEKLYKRIVSDRSDVAVCGFCKLEESGKRTEETIETNASVLTEKEWWELYRHKHTIVSNCVTNKLYKADCFEDKRFTEGIVYEDSEIQHKLLSGKTLSVIPDSLYYYLIRGGSITSKKKFNRKCFIRVNSLIVRAQYFSERDWTLAKVKALHDAIKYLYHSIYDSDMELSETKRIGHDYRQRIRTMMSFRDWRTIEQKGQCFLILYMPGFYDLLRKRAGI